VNDAPWIPLFVSRQYWLTKSYVAGLSYPPLVLSHLKYITQGEPIPAAQARLTPDRSAALPATPMPDRTIKLNQATRDLVYDPLNDRIYASVSAGAAGQGNALITIDPHTGKVGDSIPIGSSPGKLALSGDGKLLYVSLDGAGAVRQFDVTTGKPGFQFSLGSDPDFGFYVVGDMQVFPDNPDSVAIARRYVPVEPSNAGVVIYDHGIKRSKEVPAVGSPTVLAFSDSADVLYGYDQIESPYTFYTMTVAADGVTIKSQRTELLTGYMEGIVYQDGLIYCGDGRVIDPRRLELVGTYPADGLVQPDSKTHRVFFLTDHGTVLRVMDRDTYLPLAAWAIPGVLGTPSSLIRLGTDGLAFRTDQGQVFIIQTPE